MTMDFSVRAALGYRVKQDTPFVFNVQAERFPGQEIVSEKLVVDPNLKLENWTMPESGNRYFRLIAPPGGFTLCYEATIRLTHATEDPGDVHRSATARIAAERADTSLPQPLLPIRSA
jgi:hypothetical protein